MNDALSQLPKVFTVSFADLTYWNVGAQLSIRWRWPTDAILFLGDALNRRVEPLNNIKSDELVTLLTIHFDGTVEPRSPQPRKEIKGKLFNVLPGDIVFSKIDVRNGAIGLVPSNIINGCVTSEFPIYSVNQNLASTKYIKLLFRTDVFKRILNSMISGASGRKRIQPSQLETVKVPIPPLPVQKKIVENWERAQTSITDAKENVTQINAKIELDLLSRMGLKISEPLPRKGFFPIKLSEFERWDTFFYREDFIFLDNQLQSKKCLPLGSVLNFISRSWKKRDFPTGEFNYVEISSVDKDKGIISSKKVSVDKAPSRATTLIKAGDIILSTTRPYLGAFTIVPSEYDHSVCSSGFAVADELLTDEIDKEFLLFYLKSKAGLLQMERRMTGGLYPAIIQPELEKILIPVPPIGVQRKLMQEVKVKQEKIVALQNEVSAIQDRARSAVEQMILGNRPVGAL